ncbi:hypothetical protein Hypma_003322 [Hypsizygus marmoreus]|uniref:F-box domain-containing protein n=1 Tax=Hypsizygus marmoreus TaxID=39966 RepID=A0A369J9Q7_HYPMA|nr:hypothetical protein Hypma_003322 [Hypsizygus marmoreus]
MNPSVICVMPQELLDKIVDELHGDDATLKTCALASRSLLQCSQSHIFSIICLSNSALCTRLHNALVANPHISQYIQELEVIDIDPWLTDDRNLPIILNAISALQCLAFGTERGYYPWGDIPEDTKDALMSLFHLQSLTKVSLFGVCRLSMDFLAVPNHLRSLDITRTLLSTHFESSVLDVTGITADSLHVYLLNSRSSWSQDHLANVTQQCALFSKVRKLNAKVHPIALSIMKASMQSLKVIKLCEPFNTCDAYFDGYNGWLEFDFSTLPRLRRLTFHFSISFNLQPSISTAVPAALSRLRRFFTDSPSAGRAKTLKIYLTAKPAFPLQEADMDRWTELPRLLGSSDVWGEIDGILETERRSAGAPGRFRLEVSLGLWGLDVMGMGGTELVWRDAIRKGMPLAAEKGILVCELNSIR